MSVEKKSRLNPFGGILDIVSVVNKLAFVVGASAKLDFMIFDATNLMGFIHFMHIRASYSMDTMDEWLAEWITAY